MAPILRGRVLPETDSSGLVRRELRILIDPRVITEADVPRLIDLDILRQYLRTLSGPPCVVTLLTPAPGDPSLALAHEILGRHGAEALPFGTILVPEATAALGDIGKRYPEFLTLVSTAFASDADVVVARSPGVDIVFDTDFFRHHSIVFGGLDVALRDCEVFVRGHEVPWSFRMAAWNVPWTPFYVMAEPAEALVDLYRRAQETGLDPSYLELLRSLALNRHSALCYTRDKLLFYVAQRRAAKRHKLDKQDFAFELGYFLNHYYVLLWAGLDQLCRVVNAIFGLGLDKKELRRASPFNKMFLRLLREKAPPVARVFENQAFIYWAKILRGARHWVAHEGFAMPASLFLTGGEEPTDAELDAEIEASTEWQELKQAEWLAPGILEAYRPMFRHKARIRRYKAIDEPVLRVELEGGEQALTYPLLNVQWDFENFTIFANQIAALTVTRLGELSAARGTGE